MAKSKKASSLFAKKTAHKKRTSIGKSRRSRPTNKRVSWKKYRGQGK